MPLQAPFILDGTEYRSIEHYYQANKLYMLAGEQYSAHISKVYTLQNILVN